VPVYEDTLQRLIALPQQDGPLSASDALELLEVLVRRAASLQHRIEGVLDVSQAVSGRRCN
jgi:hypothetical protein